MRELKVPEPQVVAHFEARAEKYDRSSKWVADEALGRKMLEWVRPSGAERVLDVACGTGLWSRLFQGRVKSVVGVDLTPAMYRQSGGKLGALVQGRGEQLPFASGAFDVVTERQGIQFMDARVAVGEMVRVARPGGRVCLTQLCAYGQEDLEDYFEILRLRNPARRNFFLRGDLGKLLRECGCRTVEEHEYITGEDVDCWADNGAIEPARREAIREVYRRANAKFHELHAVKMADGRVVDQMLLCVAIGTKP